MKSMRAVAVLAGLGLLGTLALGSGAAVAQATPAAAPKIGSSLIGKLEGPDDRPRREGLSEDLQGGADARRAR